MIIKKITLHPFAGFVNKAFEFESGLNIVLGANEAGKSTMVKALLMVLFEPTKQTQVAGEKLLKDLLPIDGGDVVAVDLEFEINSDKFILKKQWGKTNHSSFNKENESAITDPTAVQQKMNEILIQNRAVWERIMFACQAQLASTHEKLSDGNLVSSSFDAILQNAIMNNAGIEPEVVQEKIEQQLKILINYWDIDNNTPVIGSNRKGSYDNPYKKDLGEILSLDYKIHELNVALNKKQADDMKLDQLILQIDVATNKYHSDIKSFIDQYRDKIIDYKKRVALNNQKAILDRDYDVFKKSYENWSRADIQKDLLLEGYEKAKIAREKIQNEQTVAQKKQASAVKKEKLKQIQSLMTDENQLRDIQNNRIRIEESDSTQIKLLNDNLNKGHAEFKGLKNVQKFNIEVTSTNNITVDVQEGQSPRESVDLNTAAPHLFSAEGSFELKSHELMIKIISNDAAIQKYKKGIDELEGRINTILHKYGLQSVDELLNAADSRNKNETEIARIQKAIKNLLGNDEYATLLNEIQVLDQLEESRSVETLTPLLTAALNDELSSKTKHDQNVQQIEEYKEKYETLEKLKTKYNECERRMTLIELEINQLGLPPEGQETDQSIIERYDSSIEAEKLCLENLHQLEHQKNELEYESDEVSADDYEEILKRLREEKEQKIKEAKALIRVNQKLSEIINRAPVNPYEGYHNKMRAYLNVLTNQKYTELNIEDSMPVSIKQSSSKEIPVGLLSQGTAGLLGIALRLSMADYFLENRKGFLLMDDPMTDLDETRQASTASCLTQYAEAKQVIVFTCHQSHAQLFRGHTINMN